MELEARMYGYLQFFAISLLRTLGHTPHSSDFIIARPARLVVICTAAELSMKTFVFFESSISQVLTAMLCSTCQEVCCFWAFSEGFRDPACWQPIPAGADIGHIFVSANPGPLWGWQYGGEWFVMVLVD